MKLLVGLGNPGENYKNNRHNVGIRFAESLIKDQAFKIMKSDSFMNDSGRFVAEKVRMLKVAPQNLIIVHDDLDIPLGKFKIDFGVGPKVHNGVNSIEEALGTKDFWRVRIGVDNRDLDDREAGEEYVLEDFTAEEKEVLDNLFPNIVDELKTKLF